MLDSMIIADLQVHPELIPEIVQLHFDQWGILTGASSLDDYRTKLEQAAKSPGVPSVLVAMSECRFLGSANLVACDMSVRPSLTPWLAQLMIVPACRSMGIGAALVRAVAMRAKGLGFSRLYLFTSGDLPKYYERLGWETDEHVDYLGKLRTVMHCDLIHA